MLKPIFYSSIIAILITFNIKAMEDNSEVNSSKCTKIKTIYFNSIKDFRFNKDGTKIIVIGNDSHIAEIWDVQANKIIYTLKDGAKITAANFGPYFDIIFSVNENNALCGQNPFKGYLEIVDLDKIITADNSNMVSYFSVENSTGFAFVVHDNMKKALKLYYDLKKDKPYFEYDLEDTDQLESIFILNDKYVFLRLRNQLTNNQICKVCRINEDQKIDEIDSSAICDYSISSNKLLISLEQKALYECPFSNPEIGGKLSFVKPFDSNIKSATYNPEGNQIVVITEDNLLLTFVKVKEEWIPDLSVSFDDNIIYRQANNLVGFTTSTDNIISIFKS